MTIAWTYLDKRRAAEDAIKDRGSMEYIIATHREDEAALREDLADPASSALSGLPGAHDPHAGEARLAGGIDEINVLQERYRRALEYMAWFKPAWDTLSEDDRFMLIAFYGNDEVNQTDAIGSICEQAFLVGDGVNKPTGLLNTTGGGTLAEAGALPRRLPGVGVRPEKMRHVY